jgi:hypothetical protein
MKVDWKTISLEDLAGFVSEKLREKGIDAILVGGACATIYSRNRYQSYDLDFVVYEDMKKVKETLMQRLILSCHGVEAPVLSGVLRESKNLYVF